MRSSAFQPLLTLQSPGFAAMSATSLVQTADQQQGMLSWKRLHLARAKLKASSRTSALLSGFAMVAMVEVNLSENIPQFLLVTFAICTTLLVAVHMLALMISTCILPNVEAVSSIPSLAAVSESPHWRMHWYIEMAWAFSTVLVLSWVIFYDYSFAAASAASLLLVPIVIVFLLFAVHFYRKLVTHKYEMTESNIRELEEMTNRLESGKPMPHVSHVPETANNYGGSSGSLDRPDSVRCM
ncbi:unnamed protein product [Notodromas monacha]|uniref:Calcium release-activated calcium channel protein 1 n=1 Tax=Notodromas monacha TaxID=399045 RepID=A0A7R9BG25_9CRUS|nr:unnamed protein product [Notodromas monacha]CAG0914803.1 unnamed protein product [Notodromas monacha]